MAKSCILIHEKEIFIGCICDLSSLGIVVLTVSMYKLRRSRKLSQELNSKIQFPYFGNIAVLTAMCLHYK